MKFTLGKYYSDEVSETQEFNLSKTTCAEANAVRRVILSSVQCLAIDDVVFVESNISFPQEMIKRRLENIHVTNNQNVHEGQVFRLEASCPSDMESYDVLSSSIAGLEKNINQNILILKLKANQKIKIKFELIKGSSHIHNKWSVAAAVGYDEKNPLPLDDISANESFDMFIETTNVLSPMRILTDTCDIIINMLQAAKIKEEEESIRVTKIGEQKIVVIILNDLHTVSQMISRRLLMNEKNVYKAASMVPDQLKPNSEIHLESKNPMVDYHEAIDTLQSIFQDLKKQITSVSKK